MEINLSREMIEKITCVSFGRLQDLNKKEDRIKNNIVSGERQTRRKHNQLKNIEKAKTDAKEVHELFLELLESENCI